MKILIDIQGCQSASRFRGIGRYTRSFVNAIIGNRDNDDVYLLYNARFTEAVQEIQDLFPNQLPPGHILSFRFNGDVAEMNSENYSYTRNAEKCREEYLCEIEPDIVVLTSLFEGFLDNAVTSIGQFSVPKYKTAVILYDLIPYINPNVILLDHYRNHYCRKIESFQQADIFLAISEYAHQEAAGAFPELKDKIVTISSACDMQFEPREYDETTKQKKLSQLGISRKFIMSSGTLEPRKNFLQLIFAFALLPEKLKTEYQLVIVGQGEEEYAAKMKEVAQTKGLNSSLLLPGHVEEEDLIFLYNQCSLFVFPSLLEGFGLPPLEAMSCGKPTLVSNMTSLPEVINLEDALFDPNNPDDIAEKITKVLTNDEISSSLSQHAFCQSQKFSWDLTAQKALSAIRSANTHKENQKAKNKRIKKKPILAFVSPLPPEHTGIADYSAELLPALATYYELVCIVDQVEVTDPWTLEHCTIHSPDWLRIHSDKVDRVLYQIGNSHFHCFMHSLLQEIRGIAVLHDFFSSNVFMHMEKNMHIKYAWLRELYDVHGYQAMLDYFKDQEYAKLTYPVSRNVIDNAIGIIVHSVHSKNLANQWYGEESSSAWRVVPLLRKSSTDRKKNKAREALGLSPTDFIVGSFGLVDPTKLNHVALDAWIDSKLSESKNSQLFFIGENFNSEYYKNMVAIAQKRHVGDRVKFTGRCEMKMFKLYIEAVDLAIQLRTNSRGETSASVLDCMNYGVPTIVNACGSLAEHDPASVAMLPENFSVSDLSALLEALFYDEALCQKISHNARHNVKTLHNPLRCGKLYYDAIENFYIDPHAKKMKHQKRIFLDITATQKNGLHTGIERVARALVKELVSLSFRDYRVEPVYLCCENDRWHYRFARKYTLDLLGIASNMMDDTVVKVEPGDVVLGLDFSDDMVKASCQGFFEDLNKAGIKKFHMVYDLLPIKMPQFFPAGADIFHAQWLKTLAIFDGLIAISKSVADELKVWLAENIAVPAPNLNISYIHLGADICNSVPSTGLPNNALAVIETLTGKPTFLMVGTIEPRKGYLQTIMAFSKLWNQGVDVNLVIIGSEGWKPVPDSMRRNIPEIIALIETHSERNKRLFWLEGISDEFLEKIYSSGCCLIVSSEGEGFGLPLIEAAQHKLPIIVRDIPIFREVADQHAYYFANNNDPDALARAVNDWLRLYKKDAHPKSDNMRWLTWKESAQKLLTCIGIKEK